MRIRLVAVVLVSTLLAVVGCSKDNADVSSGSSPQEVTVAALNGKTFVSTSVDGHTLVPETQITVAFENGAVRANAGCNSIGGDYTLTDSVLKGGETFASTMMGCESDLAAQDQWIAAFLAAAPTVALDGDELTLSAMGTTITLMSQSSAALASPLVGTTWALETIVSGATASSVPSGVDAPTLVLGADGQAAITTGCNTGGAAYETVDQTLSFGPVRLTKMGCSGDAKPVETAVVGVLDGDVPYVIEGATLTLTKGDQELVYRAP